MGQYFKAVNVTKWQFMESDSFLKLTETSYIKNYYIGGSLMILLLDQSSSEQFLKTSPGSKPLIKNLIGNWANNQIVLAGDYADPWQYCQDACVTKYKGIRCKEYLEQQRKNNYSIEDINHWLNNPTLYDLCDVFEEIKPFMKKSISNKKLFLVNHTKMEFVSLKNYLNQSNINNDDWIIHPLPILLAQSNGEGGGDYYGENQEFAGKWCGDIISTSFLKPDKYTEFLPFFKEN